MWVPDRVGGISSRATSGGQVAGSITKASLTLIDIPVVRASLLLFICCVLFAFYRLWR